MSQTMRLPFFAAIVPFDCMPLESTRHLPSGSMTISRLRAGLPVQSPAAGFLKYMSEKYNFPFSQVGPSVNVKPSASFCGFASAATICSNNSLCFWARSR